MRNTAFIINPNSAHGKYRQFLPAIEKFFPESPMYISQNKEGTQKFIQEHWKDIEHFIVIGGDGTVSSVAAMLIHTDKKMGIVPTGSGNGFARETDFEQNIEQLYRKILSGKFTTIDTFTINEHFGVNVAGIGFDAYVAKEFEKTKRGFLNYIKVSIKSYFSFKTIQVKGIKSDKILFEDDYFFVEIANSRQFGNNAFIAPNASLQDGRLDIILVKKFTWWKSLHFAYQLFTGKILTNKVVKSLSIDELTIQSPHSTWHIDGDYLTIPSPVNVKVIKNSLNILGDKGQ